LLSARTAFFRLLLLGLRVAAVVHRRAHAEGHALRALVCQAALTWFQSEPGYGRSCWWDHRSTRGVDATGSYGPV
jgi:hypothetical protein